MATSIREAYDICPTTGGFNTIVGCVSSLTAVIHRAGSDAEEYTINLNPSVVSGDQYTFSLPVAVFGFPVGYYDLDLYDGGLKKRTIRLNLHTGSHSGFSSEVTAQCLDNRFVAPNTEVPVVCEEKDDECPEPCVVDVNQLERCDVRLGSTFKRVEQADAAEILAFRREQERLNAKINTPIAVEFEEAEYSLAVADYYNSLFMSGVVSNGEVL